ncbi:hypothetical protein FRB99_003161 [Tulasnella sp. 403]|nr:hypothetical protein FRB99_003161 [Tulasnella sp. 403]
MQTHPNLLDGVVYYLEPSLPEDFLAEAHRGLRERGATRAASVGEATHIVTSSLDFDNKEEMRSDAVLATPTWVQHCLTNEMAMDPTYYSPDPSNFMSGVIAAGVNLPPSDVEAICIGIESFGGQWKFDFCKTVTHLFVLHPDTDTYRTAMDHKEILGLEIILPAWFSDCHLLQQRLPTEPYSFPNPAMFQPMATLNVIGNQPIAGTDDQYKSVTLLKQNDRLYRSTLIASGEKPLRDDRLKTSNVWRGQTVLLSSDLDLSEGLLLGVQNSITRNGGNPIHGDDNICDADVLAIERGILIGTVAWVFYVEQMGRITRPLDRLLHFPVPQYPIKGFEQFEITVTNYTGESREYIKKLIQATGATFTANMTQKNTHVIAAHTTGLKVERASAWNLPIINHTWLEDCFVEWKTLPIAGVSAGKYYRFPRGLNFMSLLGEKSLMGFKSFDPRKIFGEAPNHPVILSGSTGNGHKATALPTHQSPTTKGLSPSNAKRKKPSSNVVDYTELFDGDEDFSAVAGPSTKLKHSPSKTFLQSKPPSPSHRDSSRSPVKPLTTRVSHRSRRVAAERAEEKLHNDVMPDVNKFEKDMKKSGGDVRRISVVAGSSRPKRERSDEDSDHVQRAAQRRKSDATGLKAKPKMIRKGKVKASPHDDSDVDSDLGSRPKSSRTTDSESNDSGPAPQPKNARRAASDSDDSDGGKPSGGTKWSSVQNPRIMTTQWILKEDQKKQLQRMGAKFVDRAAECTHLVASNMRRTIKFLCAISCGVEIVDPQWLAKSIEAKRFLDEKPFFLKESEDERFKGFDLQEALQRARRGSKIFAGHTFYVTQGVYGALTKEDLKSVVEANGGKVSHDQLKDRTLAKGGNRYVVSCEKDKLTWKPLLSSNARLPIYSTEIILQSAMTQTTHWETCRVEGSEAVSPTVNGDESDRVSMD